MTSTADTPVTSARTRRVRRAGLTALLLVGVGGVAAASAALAAPTFSAVASVTAPPQYLGDSVGTTFTFRVKNTGTTRVAAVELSRPSSSWTVSACPTGPLGWSRTTSPSSCRYVSQATTADDLAPGATKAFALKAKTAHGAQNRHGVWKVRVSRSAGFATASNVVTATSSRANALRTSVYTWQVISATVAGSPRLGACPPLVKSAHAGSSKPIVVCARNHAYTRLRPVATSSSLGGTFVKTPGTFAGAAAPARSGPLAVASWNGTVITRTVATARTAVVKVGSSSTATSPTVTLSGYSSKNIVPVAADDSIAATEDLVRTGNVMGNDTDGDGDPLTATLVSSTTHGTLTLAGNGAYSYTPDANFNGTDSFTYRVNDGFTNSPLATATFTVAPVNDQPVASAVSATLSEDAASHLVTLSATDVDRQALTFLITDAPDHGSLTSTGAVDCLTVAGTCTQTYSYVPDPNFNGTDSFSYTANDGLADSATASGTLTVNAVNDAPIATNDARNVAEDGILTVDAAGGVLANDSDPDGDALTATVVSDTGHGTLTLHPDGSFTYTPDSNYSGNDSFTYSVSDGTLASTADVSIAVGGVNDAPTTTALAETTSEDQAKSLTLPATDGDGDTLTYSVVTGPAHGSLGAFVGNLVTYTPDLNYAGADSFTFKVNDGATDSNTSTVSLTVTAVNDAPVAVPDAYSTDEDTPLTVAAPGVLGNDTDVESDPLTAVLVTEPEHGVVTLNGDGSFVYTPAANYGGPDSFSYKVNDGTDDSAGDVTAVTINAVNDAPTAGAVSVSTDEDTPKALTMTGTDVEGSVLEYSIVTGPSHGSLGAITGDSVTYTPDANYSGPDSFTYKTNDGTADSAPATVSITVVAVNDVPVAAPVATTTNEDTAKAITLVGSDVESGSLSYAIVSGPAHGSLGTVSGSSVTYTPAANYSGPDSFTYTVSDGVAESAPATVSITVDPINDAPTAAAVAATTAEDTPKAVTLAGSDTEGSSLAYSIVTGPTHGSLGAITGNTVTYTPDADYHGSDSFTYKANDGTADSPPATITITVTGVNDAPVANDDGPYQTLQDANLVLPTPGVLANDVDVDVQPLTAGNASDPAHGAVTLNANGSFTYTPDAGYLGGDVFTYDVSDGTATDSATVTVNVVSPNATPTADATSGTGNEDGGPVTLTLTGHDDDGDALTFTAGTATSGLVTVPGAVTCGGTPSTCTATVTYTPNANFFGTDSFTYTASDGTVSSAPAIATVTVSPVNDAPSFTKGANQTVNEDAGAQSVTGWATGVSPGPGESAQAVTFSVTTDNDGLFAAGPAVAPNGTLTYTPASNANGVATVTVRVSDDGGTANGGVDTSPAQTFTITVGSVNDAPSFTKGPDQSVLEDAGAQSVSNWATAISKGPGDESAQTLSFTTSNDNNSLFSVQPGVTPTGTLVYTPAPNAVGSATVTISLSDNGGTADGGDDTSDAQTFTITVSPVNDSPSFSHAGDQTVLEDSGARTVNGFVTAASPGPANESAQTVTVAVTNVTNPSLFSVAPSISNGVLTYTPATDANGSSTVSVRATDDGGTANGGVDTSPTQTFTITVTPVNDAPAFTKGADQTVNEDAGAQSVSNWATSISAGPANESAQTLTFSTSNSNNALFATQPTVSPSGTLTYTSAPNQYGTATVTVSLSDNGGTANGGDDASDSQTFTITVNAVNDAPIAAPKAYTVQANMKISLGGLLTGASDPNDVAGDPSWSPSFTLGSITPGAGCVGCTVSNIDTTNGTFDFDPPAGGTGSYTATYTVVDNGHPGPGATSAPQTITFTVNGPVIWFVDASLANAGTGRLSAPFNTLAAATTAMGSTTNQRIFVRGGNVTGNVTLPTDGWLISEATTGTSFDTVMGITPPAGTIARPAVNGTQRTLTGTVTVGTNSVVRGFDLTPTATNRGLVASGRTGLVVNQMSITTTTARAVDLLNSAGVFTLTRVSANGGDRGISLDSVNPATGSFTVTGTGTAGSGGTISNTTGTGVHLVNTRDIVLSRMNIQDTGGDGIHGSGVTNLTLTGVQVLGAGDADEERAVDLANMRGTLAISGGTYNDASDDLVKVLNTSANLTLTAANATFSNQTQTLAGNAFDIVPNGTSAITASITGNTFSNLKNTSVNWGAAALGSSGASTLTFTGNTVNGGAQGGAGVVVSGQESTTTTTTISNNTFSGAGGNGVVNHDVNDASTVLATVANNTFTSPKGHGIVAAVDEDGDLRLRIDANTITDAGGDGIELTNFGDDSAAAMTSTAHFVVTNNTVNGHSKNPATAFAGGIVLFHFENDADTTCARVTGNTVTGTPVGYYDVFLQDNTSSKLRFEEIPDTAATGTVSAAYIQSKNPGTTASLIENIGAVYSNGVACTNP